MLIRLARPAEHEAVGEFTFAAYAADGVIDAEADYAESLRDAAGRAGRAELWVAVDEADTLLGTFTWCPPGSALQEVAGPGEAELRMLAVDAPGRGRGTGRALLEHCLERARRDRLTLALCTGTWMVAAQRLYESSGFERVPERDWSPRDGVALLAYRRVHDPERG